MKLSTIFRGVLCALTLIFAAGQANAQAQSGLGGGYYGVDEANGMRLDLSPTGAGVTGALTAVDGTRFPFDAAINPQGGADGKMAWAAGEGVVRLNPKDIGVVLVWAPMDDAGAVLRTRVQALLFVRDGVPLPPPPENYAPAPKGPGETVDSLSFLYNYEFWPADGVGYGYAGMAEKYRSLIALFPMVQTDILWKLCGADRPPAGLGEALRGQGATCADVLDRMAAAQRSGGFSAFKNAMLQEKQKLIQAVQCGRGMGRPETCREVARQTQEAALSMETVATVLQRLR